MDFSKASGVAILAVAVSMDAAWPQTTWSANPTPPRPNNTPTAATRPATPANDKKDKPKPDKPRTETPAADPGTWVRTKQDEMEKDIARLLTDAAQNKALDLLAINAQISYRMVIHHLYEASLDAPNDLAPLEVLRGDMLRRGLEAFDTLITETPQWEKVLASKEAGAEQQKLQARVKPYIEVLTAFQKATQKVNRKIENRGDLDKYTQEMLKCLAPLVDAELQAAPKPEPWPEAPAPAAAPAPLAPPTIEETLAQLEKSTLPPKFREIAASQLGRMKNLLADKETAADAKDAYSALFDALQGAQRLQSSLFLSQGVKDKLLDQCQLGIILLGDTRTWESGAGRLKPVLSISTLAGKLAQATLEPGPKQPLGNLLERTAQRRIDQPRNKANAYDLTCLDNFLEAQRAYGELRNKAPALAMTDWARLRLVGDTTLAAGIEAADARVAEIKADEEALRKQKENDTAGTGGRTAGPARDDTRKPDDSRKLDASKKLTLPDAAQKLTATTTAMTRINKIPGLVKEAMIFGPKPENGVALRAQNWIRAIVTAVEQGTADNVERDLTDFQEATALLAKIRKYLPNNQAEESVAQLAGGAAKYDHCMELFRANEHRLVNALAAPGALAGLTGEDSSGFLKDLRSQYALLRAAQEYARITAKPQTLAQLNTWGAWQVEAEAMKLFLDQASSAITSEFQNLGGGASLTFVAPDSMFNLLTYPQAGPAVLRLAEIQQTVAGGLSSSPSTWASCYLQVVCTPGDRTYFADKLPDLAQICLNLNEAAFSKQQESNDEAQAKLKKAATALGSLGK